MNYLLYCEIPAQPLVKTDVTYKDGNTGKMSSIKSTKLESKQLPAGSTVSQTVNGAPTCLNVTGTYSPGLASFTRTIKYGIEPALNDTNYVRSYGTGPIDAKEGV